MARQRKKYSNGQSRGTGTQPQKRGAYEKDYHRQEVAFHGSESNYTKWSESGRKGYL